MSDNRAGLDFARLVLDISRELIDRDARYADAGVLSALAEVGTFVGADRAYVFLLRDGGRVADNTHEWCSTGVKPQATRLQGLEIDAALPWFAGFMRRHEVFNVPRVSQLPPEGAAERAEFEAESIRSLLVVPMVYRGNLCGFLGFDLVRAERAWCPDDVAILRILGEILIVVLERGRVEGALKRSEDRYRSLVEHTSDWVWETNAQGAYTYASPKVRELTGYEPHELVGRAAFDLMPPGEAERVARVYAEHAEARRPIRRLENQVVHRDGHIVWLETSAEPLLGADGQLAGYRGIDRDVTERKRAEIEREALEARVRETQKLESLGRLAGGIAHDFNNLLTAILAQAGVARRGLAPGGGVARCLEVIEAASVRGAELTRQLLAYSGRGGIERSGVDLPALVRELLPLLEVSASKSCDLRTSLGPVPPIEADAPQLRQVLMNLVINASDAFEGGPGTIVISCGVGRLEPRALARNFFQAGADDQEVAFLEVTDDGPGIPPAVVAHVFEPFYSTKASGRGLGLAAVLGIVRGHHGGIAVSTEPGKGSRIAVLLPLARRPVATAKPAPARPEPVGGGRILVVDDDRLVRRAAAAALEDAGFEVLEAPDGPSALEVFGRRADDIDAVFLDTTMPGMTGVEVLAGLRAIRPQVPVLVTSGFAADDTAERYAEAPPAGYLGKPFSADALIDAVTLVLQRARGPEE